MAKQPPITPEMCRKWLRYEPHTGKLFWLPRTADDFTPSPRRSAEWMANNWNAQNAGNEAFTALSHLGYRFGTINRHVILAHRVIWAIVSGEWPSHIDHVNGDRCDNRLENLRNVTNAMNCRNKGLPIPASGRVGVRWVANRNQWQARIGKRTHLGWFKSRGEAIAAREKAEREHGYHANHARRRPRSS